MREEQTHSTPPPPRAGIPQQEPGWYRHPDDPPDTVRHWDGSTWTTGAVRRPGPTTDPSADPKDDEEKRRRASATLVLDFVGKPQIVETPAGLQVEITVLNRGPVEAAFSFDLQLKGGSTISVANPEIVIQVGDPVSVSLSVPLDSGITTNTSLAVGAKHGGVSAGVSATTGGGLTVGLVGGLVAGVVALGVGVGIIAELVDDDDGGGPTETAGEVVESPSTAQPEEEGGRTPQSLFDGGYLLPAEAVSFEYDGWTSLGVLVELELTSDADCVRCTYRVLVEGEAIGEVELAETTAPVDVAAEISAGPFGGNCFDVDTGAEIDVYTQSGTSDITFRAAVEDGELDLDVLAVQDVTRPGTSTPECPTPLQFTSSYSLDGSSGFTVEPIDLPEQPVDDDNDEDDNDEDDNDEDIDEEEEEEEDREEPPEVRDGFEQLPSTAVNCTSDGQACDVALAFEAFATSGPQALTLTAGSGHCALIRFFVLVDGELIGGTDELGAGEQGTVSLTAAGVDVAADPTSTVIVEAQGVEGGCNNGTLASWAVAVSLSGLASTTDQPTVVTR